MKFRLLLCALLFSMVESLTSQALAQPQLITSREALGASDTIDWGQLGPQSTNFPNPVMVMSIGGVEATVSQLSGTGTRIDQNTITGFVGNFTLNDRLYYTGNVYGAQNLGPISVIFDFPVYGVGTQIVPNYRTPSSGNFVASITAYNTAGQILGTFTEDGEYNGAQDGSAIFIGISNSEANIARIEFGLTEAPLSIGDFTINQISFATTPIPEPSCLMAVALITSCGAGWLRYRCRLTKRCT
ncbi:MAG: hypothetical protein SFX18_10940 [Pirellulales bacterium]|nr:hypothetical protein [Pirellulales bacterium]